ncbi:RNA polymerase sigma factor [Streptomyces fructofermentans]|uniref:RNA polymerase sigma factor n=1 Tax=Streptomyces fructofermentans TaxID=152141 RepID=A0A918NL88_9ACTN|nr:sigma-70 family RNA polymerase sigma factor [Streptomyces fructofermentans]GGX78213.1 RNA polymerase sigma factor [Streptomyces fructofermentans]
MSAEIRRETSPPRQTAEYDLVDRARAGDREAFAALYVDHQRFVYRYLLFRTRNRHLAEDLTQEVFVRALRHIDSFTWQGSAFTAWLLTIARNLHLDEVKTKRSRVETLVSELRDSDAHDRSAEFAALRALEAVETHEAVWNALHTLNAHQRQCMELRFIGEMSPEETACAMGRTVGAVKALTFRAMQKLRTASEREAAA